MQFSLDLIMCTKSDTNFKNSLRFPSCRSQPQYDWLLTLNKTSLIMCAQTVSDTYCFLLVISCVPRVSDTYCFLQVLPCVPRVIEVLKQDKSADEDLKRVTELLHCCMYLHAGYPDLYDPVVEHLKVFYFTLNFQNRALIFQFQRK